MNIIKWLSFPFIWIFVFLFTLPLHIISLFLIIIGIIISPFAMLTSKERPKRYDDPNYPQSQDHDLDWIAAGSSGHWDFWGFSDFWWLWDNDEDGHLGEPSGKWSATRLGNERSYLSRWLWCFIRNPVNNFLRTKIGGVNMEKLTMKWFGIRERITDDDLESGFCVVLGRLENSWYPYFGLELTVLTNGYRVHHRMGYKIDAEKQDIDIKSDKEQVGFTFQLLVRKL